MFPNKLYSHRQYLWRALLSIKIFLLFYFYRFVLFIISLFKLLHMMHGLLWAGSVVSIFWCLLHLSDVKISSAEVLVLCLLSSFQLSALSFNRIYLKQKLNQGYCYYKVYLTVTRSFWKSTIWLMGSLIRRLIKLS